MVSQRYCSLNIIEPWEFGTDKAIDAILIDRNEGEYLLSLFQPRVFGEKQIRYLLLELRNKSSSVDLLNPKEKGVFPINLVFMSEIDPYNFKKYRITDFRANFLLGDIILR